MNAAPHRRYIAVPAGTYAAPVRPAADVLAADVPPEPRVMMRPLTNAEPDLDAVFSGPASAAFPSRAEPRRTPFRATSGLERLAARESRSADWAPRAGRRMILAGTAGACAGAVLGLILLALSRPEGSLTAILNPVTLWHSVDDTRLKLTAALVLAGFALLGSAFGARTSRS